MRWRRAHQAAWLLLVLLLPLAPAGADESAAPASADPIDGLIDAGHGALSGWEPDIPTEEPPPPKTPQEPPPVPPRPPGTPVIVIPRSVEEKLDSGDLAEIQEVGEYAYQQQLQTTDDNERAYLEGVRQRAKKAHDRALERISSGAPAKNDDAPGADPTTTRDGLRFGNRPTQRYVEDVAGPQSTSGAMDDTPDDGEAAAAFGHAAFGERTREDAGVVVTPRDQGWFEGGRSLHAPSPAHQGRSDPSKPTPKRRRRRGTTEPRPPTSGRRPSSFSRDGGLRSLFTEKGVRIQFDPAALAAARFSDAALAAMEDRLLGARSPGDVAAALRQHDHVLARRLFGGLEETIVRGVTIVSLRRLVEDASAWRGRWDALPERLRHPGGLRRLVGFFRAADGSDLFLLGTTEGAYPPVDLDDLVVGLRASWRDGVAPVCSLEPDPRDPSGPQRTVVVGIPKHTHFADVMLRADYEMKRVQFGHRPSEVPGFVNLAEAARRALLERGAAKAQVTARAWFMPIQPQPGEIRLSPDGNLALLRSGMQLMTETMARRGGQLVGTGRRDPLLEQTTDFMTEHLAAFEREIPEFGQLHGLFDIVLLGNVLQREGIRVDVLDRLLELPVRNVRVPDSYPGVTQIIRHGPLQIGVLMGGVSIDPRLQAAAVVRSDDPRMNALGLLCADATGLRTELPGAEAPLFRARGAVARRKENAHVQASRHGSRVEAIVAARVIGRLIRASPGDVALYVLRAQAYAAARLYALADRDLLVAERRSRTPAAFRLARLQVALDREPQWDPGRVDLTDREPLAALYATSAMQRLGAGADEEAARQIERALALAPDHAEYMVLRVALAGASGNSAEAERMLARYLERNPSSTVLQLAWARRRVDAKDYDAGIEAATRVLEDDPDNVDARILRALAVLRRDSLDTEDAYRDLEAALEVQPHSGRLQVLLAQLLAAEGDTDGAKVAAQRAIEFAPGLAVAHATWAKLLAGYELGPSQVIGSHPDRKERFELLGVVNTALLLQAPPFALRLIRSELLMQYAAEIEPDRLGVPPWFEGRAVADRIAGAMVESPASAQIFAKLKALGQPEDQADLRRMLTLYRRAIVHTALADLQAAARTAPADNIRKHLERKALELQRQLPGKSPR